MNLDQSPAVPNPEHSHVIFVQGVKEYPLPIFHMEIKPATDQAEAILTDNPGSSCLIYQLRTSMQSTVEVVRKDFKTT